MLTRTVVDLLRHGEVQGEPCFRGMTDTPLSEQGWRQMQQRCGDMRWDAVLSSPLHRCQAFAAAQGKRQPAAKIVPDWREIDFGAWEGRTAQDIGRNAAEDLAAFYADPTGFTPPGAESYKLFAARVRRAWEDLLDNHAGQNVLVVTHGGVIRALFAQLLEIEPRHSFKIDLPYACMTRFSCFDDGGGRFVRLDFHNTL